MVSAFAFAVSHFMIMGTDAATMISLPLSQQIEIAGPTLRSHEMKARCGLGRLNLSWEYTGKIAQFKLAEFNGKNIESTEFARLNEWAREMNGDFFVWSECDSGAAIISLIEAGYAGTKLAKQIQLNFVEGKLKLVRRINFAQR